MELPERPGYPPSIRFLILIIERLNLLRLLGFAQPGGVIEFEELGREFHEPLGVDGGYFAHVLLGGQDQLVVNDPGNKGVLIYS